MTSKEILENNKLIAEFMGWKEHPKHKNCSINKNRDRVLPYWVQYNMEIPNDEFGYHNSWDWLVPVLDKIEEVIPKEKIVNSDRYFIDTLYKEYCPGDERNRIEYIGTFDPSYSVCIGPIYHSGNDKKETVYKAIIKFIKWYNEENTNN